LSLNLQWRQKKMDFDEVVDQIEQEEYDWFDYDHLAVVNATDWEGDYEEVEDDL